MYLRLRSNVICLVALVALLSGCHPAAMPASQRAGLSDVEFAKSTFAALGDGDATVEADIDWDHFKAAGSDIGAKYNEFSDEPNRSAFRKSFIKSYSESFKKSGGNVDSLTGWKEAGAASNSATVTAQTQSHTQLKLTLAKSNGSWRLAGIDIGQ